MNDQVEFAARPKLSLAILFFVVLIPTTVLFWGALFFWELDGYRGGQIEFIAPVAAPYMSLYTFETAAILARNWPKAFQIGREWIHDKRVTKRAIPWSAINSIRLTKGFGANSALSISLKEGSDMGSYGKPGFFR